MHEILSTNPADCIRRARLRDLAKGSIKKLDDNEKDSLIKVMRKVKTNVPVKSMQIEPIDKP